MPKKNYLVKIVIILTTAGLSAGVFVFSNALTPKQKFSGSTSIALDHYVIIPDIDVKLSCSSVRFCSTDIALAVTADDAGHLCKPRYHSILKDSIITSITSYCYSELLSLEGKIRLKKTIQGSINGQLGHESVVGVYIMNFLLR